jgi:hypothetical protein
MYLAYSDKEFKKHWVNFFWHENEIQDCPYKLNIT